MLATTSDLLGGMLLLAAGIFQVTPLKQACLSHCRSPLGFLMSEWRNGFWGAFVMGLKHGAFCTGCCWALMLLMFVFGVMNLAWMALLTVLILVEKLAGSRWHLIRGVGIALVIGGVAFVFV
jgi:predicted metal-binding membrane protein